MIAPLPDLGLIAGETVTVRTPTIGYDEHMEEVVTWDIHNHLVGREGTD